MSRQSPKRAESDLVTELALAIEWGLRTNGADGVSFDVIVASGAHSALPHAMPRGAPADLDGVLLIDMGAKVEGYCSDMTRTFLGPEAPNELVRVHDAVLRALDAACRVVAPGRRCVDIDGAARSVLGEEGLGEAFVHSTGHGVGLEIHEAPRLGVTGQELVPGDVVSVDPYALCRPRPGSFFLSAAIVGLALAGAALLLLRSRTAQRTDRL
jgi:Xaa-Pro aminopeptidase